jgi:hypothetical protein
LLWFLDDADKRPLPDLDEDRRVERDVEVLGVDLLLVDRDAAFGDQPLRCDSTSNRRLGGG